MLAMTKKVLSLRGFVAVGVPLVKNQSNPNKIEFFILKFNFINS